MARTLRRVDRQADLNFDEWLAAPAAQRTENGLTRRLSDADRGAPMVDLAGNDYLGLRRHPAVVAAAADAAHRFGVGAGASRLVTGTLSVHSDLEDELAEFVGFPTALVFSTGYHANLSAVAALADRDTLIVSDAHVHASLIDACRLSRATVHVVRHNALDEMQAALAAREQCRALVLVETIYSVLGDRAPLLELARMCAAHNAVLVADEAHALGVCGPGGRGLLNAAGLAGRADVVATVTLSKSLGAQGGAVLSSGPVRDHLVNTARPFIFDTGLAPPSAGGALAAVRLMQAEPERIRRLSSHAAALASALGVPAPEGSVLSVPMTSPAAALEAVAIAASRGIRVGCFRPPSTPDGSSRLRVTAHADHTEEELARGISVLDDVAHLRLRAPLSRRFARSQH